MGHPFRVLFCRNSKATRYTFPLETRGTRQRFGFKLVEIRRVLQLWILPSDTGAPSPYHEGSQECRREALKLGEKKLQEMNEQIRSSIQLRDELQAALSQIRAGLNVPLPQKISSDRPKSSRSAAIAAS